ncbi:M20 family peptidase [Chondrinema litorale]|uniref:M20 family peptidase n=1 Tax=Chondrinema litorale TaxID=2994555 RepID=UPI002543ED1A|nr:M20 family peptidase [Chondrinema litorale]UZR95695.1 M20 family peptidase [Chondrinema litorale]
MIKKLLLGFLLLSVCFVAVLLWNTIQMKPKDISVEPVEIPETDEAAIERFASAIRIPTVSHESEADFDSIPFLDFAKFLAQTYPYTDSLLEKRIVNRFSLLYKWEGKNSSLKPVVFMGHMDVVPVAAPQSSLKTEKAPDDLKANINSIWDVAPFGGEIKDGFIWGRGAVDDKISVIGNMEAAEKLLREGYKPERTIYFAFGHDEELGGEEGAKIIVELLKSEKVYPEFVMDEGGIITTNKIPNVTAPVALVGIAEKGFISATLSVDLPGGHSSMPGDDLAIEVLSNAIVKLRQQQPESRLTPPAKEFLLNIGPLMPFAERIVFANLWLFEGLMVKIYEGSSVGNATVRTTTAPTIFNSGYKDNVLPTKAKATVNFRILPGETTDDVVAHIKEVVADDRIVVEKGNFLSEPSPVSPTSNGGFKLIEKSILQIFPEVNVAPYLVVGGTDSRYYNEICENIYRFTPITDPIGFHDINERLSIEDYKKSIVFYYQIIKNAGNLK